MLDKLVHDKLYPVELPIDLEMCGREYVDNIFYDKLSSHVLSTKHETRKSGFFLFGSPIVLSGHTSFSENLVLYIAKKNELIPETVLDELMMLSFQETINELIDVKFIYENHKKLKSFRYFNYDNSITQDTIDYYVESYLEILRNI